MRKLGRFGTVALVALLVLAGGQVFADEHEDLDGDGDTTFNIAYDPVNQVLLWHAALSDGPYDCSLEQAGSLSATYGITIDGVVPVSDLRLLTGDPVAFEPLPPDEVGDDIEPAEEPNPYAGSDGLCGVAGAEVAGPQGQVNHGSFMRLFNSLYEGQGRGCVARYLAQSGFGHGDQQVQVDGGAEEAEETEEVSLDGAEADVDFLSFAATCERGNGNRNGNSNGNENSNGNGPKEDKGRPDSPGNSGNAPGHNK